MSSSVEVAGDMSVVRGMPLSEETGIGALHLSGYLREVTALFGPREAAVMRIGETVERWTYDALWDRSMAVARALIACGVGKGTRVGILATNRLEFLSSLFGTALAGGVATTISSFFTTAELDVVLRASGCSVLLLERNVLKKDFAAMLVELEPQIATADAGKLASLRFPFLRHLTIVDSEDSFGAIEGWTTFLARGERVSTELVEAA